MNRAAPAAVDRAPSAGDATSAVTRIDQIVYAWSRRTRAGTEGYFPVASSLSSAATRSWNGLLAAQVEAGDSPVDRPPPTLAYVVGAPDRPARDDPDDVPDAALVHHTHVAGRSGAGSGRLRAHVLIGRADYLTERVALALHAAGGATAAGARTTPRLEPLHLDDLTAQRRAGERTLRQAARASARRNRLTVLVSTALTWSWMDRPVVVSPTGSTEAVTLMWALVEMLEGVLPYRLTFAIHAAPPTPRRTSPAARAAGAANGPAWAANGPASAADHATRASAGATTGLGRSDPRFRFVPVPPELGPGTDPAVIHVDPRVAPPVPPTISDAAHLLVDVYGRGGIRGVSDLLALVGDEAFRPHDPERWCHRLLATGGRDAAVAGSGVWPGPGTAGSFAAGSLSADPLTADALTADALTADALTADPPPTAPQPSGPGPIDSQPIDPSPIDPSPIDPNPIGHPHADWASEPAWPSPGRPAPPPADARSPAAPLAGRGAAGQALAVAEHLHDAYELVLAPGGAVGDDTDPAGRLIAILTHPVGLPADLPSAERLRGQLHRVAGRLTTPGASGQPPRSATGQQARPGPQSREQGRDMIVAGVLDRLGCDPADRVRITADVEAAVVEEQRQVEGALTALADDLAALRGPSPTRGAEQSSRQAIGLLTAGLDAVFSSYRLATAGGSARRLAAETLDALRTVRRPAPAATPPAATPPVATQSAPTTPPSHLEAPPSRIDRPAGAENGFEVTVTVRPPAAVSPAVAAAAHRQELEQAAWAAVTRHVAAAYRTEWSYWDGRLHPVDRLLAVLGVPLGISLAESGPDPLADPLESPTELRELAALRDLFGPLGPPAARSRPQPDRPPGRCADVLARAASDVTQAITRLTPERRLAEVDRTAYVAAVHSAVEEMHRQIVQLLAGLVTDLAALPVAAQGGTDRPDETHRAARMRDLLAPALRTVFDRFGLTEGFAFADALADELAWLTAGPAPPTTARPATGLPAHEGPAQERPADEQPADERAAGGWPADGRPAESPAESPAAAVVRLLRETRSWGADAFRILVLYAPGWHGAEDVRYAIAAAVAAEPGGFGPPGADDDGSALLAAGARPFFERLATARPGGRQVVDTVARVLDLYVRGDDGEASGEGAASGEEESGGVHGEGGEVRAASAAPRSRRPTSSAAELHALGGELTRRIPPTAAAPRDPAVAFLDACTSGRPDAARVFGLLVRYVPSWDDAWDLYEAIWSRGTPRRDGRMVPGPPSAAELGAAGERYFRHALRAGDGDGFGSVGADDHAQARGDEGHGDGGYRDEGYSDEGYGDDVVGTHAADLERVVRRLVALYLPDDPRLRAAHELPGFVESRVIGEIAAGGETRRRRRSFGLPVFALTLAVAVLALLVVVR
ncbi:hypothetical protein [Frankia sp. AvcI1]|uniref:hypothetical protein n=1 Tax=Frankia sp. AvcI1 TaxID=573496 RepID=UPI00211944A8|nr:hypothetical protein [Frankia sp. AvcI1]